LIVSRSKWSDINRITLGDFIAFRKGSVKR